MVMRGTGYGEVERPTPPPSGDLPLTDGKIFAEGYLQLFPHFTLLGPRWPFTHDLRGPPASSLYSVVYLWSSVLSKSGAMQLYLFSSTIEDLASQSLVL